MLNSENNFERKFYYGLFFSTSNRSDRYNYCGKGSKVSRGKAEEQTKVKALSEDKLPLSKKITRLSGFLWGGSGLLAFEHLWHGEISPFFPFLTAANDPSEMAVAFHEMATVGTSMAVLVTAVWAVLTVVSDKILKRKPKETAKLGGDAV